jgi:hypothetical protein
MQMKDELDILAEVRKYIATATPEQVAKDLEATGFEAYKGIGPEVCLDEDIGLIANVPFVTQQVWTTMLSPSAAQFKPFDFSHVSFSYVTCESLAGNYEEMPLAG